MPVMLTEPQEFEQWLTAPVERALQLQKSFPHERLKIVATGIKADDVVEVVTSA
jgi:putative SOS response-associated peptidase YedK